MLLSDLASKVQKGDHVSFLDPARQSSYYVLTHYLGDGRWEVDIVTSYGGRHHTSPINLTGVNGWILNRNTEDKRPKGAREIDERFARRAAAKVSRFDSEAMRAAQEEAWDKGYFAAISDIKDVADELKGGLEDEQAQHRS